MSAPYPSEPAVMAAVRFIRDHAAHARNDGWPADIAAPTSLYLGMALREACPKAGWVALAEMANICRADAIEWGGLCELASGRGAWVDRAILERACAELTGKRAHELRNAARRRAVL